MYAHGPSHSVDGLHSMKPVTGFRNGVKFNIRDFLCEILVSFNFFINYDKFSSEISSIVLCKVAFLRMFDKESKEYALMNISGKQVACQVEKKRLRPSQLGWRSPICKQTQDASKLGSNQQCSYDPLLGIWVHQQLGIALWLKRLTSQLLMLLGLKRLLVQLCFVMKTYLWQLLFL